VAKLLVIAPGCDKEDVGESWVGHQWVHRLARSHQVTLLSYYKRGKVPPSRQLAGVRVVDWPEPPLVGRLERLNSMLKPGYPPFHFRARRWLRGALAAGERFDLAYQPVPVAMRYPCPAAGLGIPYVIGPVGGSLASPSAFSGEEGTAAWYVGLRSLDRLRMRWDPQLRRTYSGAACVLGIAPYVEEFLRPVPLRRFEVMSETGIEALPGSVDRSGRTGDVRLLYVGRLVRTKGARDAIRAMARLRDLPVVLDVVGEGSDRAACQALAAELGLSPRVRFHGWVPRERTADFYRAADVFVFPSYREPGGNVVFEAMGFGLPLVVCERGGPGNVVDEASGMTLPAVSPDQLAGDIATAVATLVREPQLRLSMGAAARRRVADIALWDRKLERMESLFGEIIEDSHQPV
jgi:glycosyltransferase involved in cell wall biosynthesis